MFVDQHPHQLEDVLIEDDPIEQYFENSPEVKITVPEEAGPAISSLDDENAFLQVKKIMKGHHFYVKLTANFKDSSQAKAIIRLSTLRKALLTNAGDQKDFRDGSPILRIGISKTGKDVRIFFMPNEQGNHLMRIKTEDLNHALGPKNISFDQIDQT